MDQGTGPPPSVGSPAAVGRFELAQHRGPITRTISKSARGAAGRTERRMNYNTGISRRWP